MKTKNQIEKYIPFTLMILLMAVGLFFAIRVYRAYEPIAEGILGMTLLVLAYRIFYFSPIRNVNEPVRLLFENPSGFNYLGLGVFWSIVFYWAISQIIDMFQYFIKLSNN